MYQAIKNQLLWCRVLSLSLSAYEPDQRKHQRKLRAARRSHTAGAGSTTISARR